MKRINIVILISTLMFFLSISFKLYAQSEIHFANGQKALQLNNFEEAIKHFSKAIDSDSINKSGAYYNRGIAYLYSNKFMLAIDDFSIVISKEKKNADAYNNRSLCYSTIGDFEKALEDANQAIKIDSKFAEAYINRGTIHQSMDNLDKAKDDFTKAIKLDPNNPSSYYQRAIINYQLEKLKEAVSDFTMSIDKGIDDTRIFYNRANAYFKLKKYKLAIKDYNVVLNNNPEDIEALNNRAFTYLQLGDSVKAKNDRDLIKTINMRFFPPIDSLEFVEYSTSNGKISIKWPAGWNMYQRQDGYSTEMIITIDSLASMDSPYSVGLRLSLNEKMSEIAGVQNPDDILAFYDNMTLDAIKSYKDYQNYTKKSEKFGLFIGWLKLSRAFINEVSEPIDLYELYLAKDNTLFFAVYQASNQTFGSYYKEIFDRTYKSLIFRDDEVIRMIEEAKENNEN